MPNFCKSFVYMQRKVASGPMLHRIHVSCTYSHVLDRTYISSEKCCTMQKSYVSLNYGFWGWLAGKLYGVGDVGECQKTSTTLSVWKFSGIAFILMKLDTLYENAIWLGLRMYTLIMLRNSKFATNSSSLQHFSMSQVSMLNLYF